MNKKSLNKTITAVLLSGSLFLGGSNLAFAQDTVDLTLDNTVAVSYTHLTLPTNSLV